MQASSEIIRVLREEESVVQLVSHNVQDGVQRAYRRFSYYFMLPKTPVKRGRKANRPRTLCAFGPFASADHARFISISAHAFGLIGSATAKTSPGAKQTPPARPRDESKPEDRSEYMPTHLFTPAVVELIKQPDGTSHAA